MINKILDGITVKLDDIFGYPIYTDNVEQGFKPPCFFVRNLNIDTSPQLCTRQKRDALFDLSFFPNEGRRQMHEIEDSFFNNFDLIALADGEMVYGINMRTEIEDDVLHCFVSYNTIMQRKEPESDYMEEIEIGETV